MRHRPNPRSKVFVSFALLGGALLAANPVSAQQISLVSSASDGTPGEFGAHGEPSISADGRFVAFQSLSETLVSGDTNGMSDLFVKDRLTNTITRVNVTSTGGQSPADTQKAKISGNGRFVAFDTIAPLVAEDTSNCAPASEPNPVACYDVYIHDRQTGTTTLVSVSSAEVQANNGATLQDISADGRFVLFSSPAANLVVNDTNGRDDLFVRDMQIGTTARVSLDSTGSQFTQTALLFTGKISANGRFVLYGPGPGVPQGDLGGVVYLHDRDTSTVTIVSNAFPPRNLSAVYTWSIYYPAFISDDGQLVAVNELAPAPPPLIISPLGEVFTYDNATRHHLHDRSTGHTTVTPWRTSVNIYDGLVTGLSGDGRTYSTTGAAAVLVLKDRVSGFEETIPGTEQQGNRYTALSADGRFTVFLAKLAGDAFPQMHVYDRDSGDGDGMPSAWETTFGLNPSSLTDAISDGDTDGLSNLEEYRRGTHPNGLASARRYFAEGASNAFFTTRLAAVNPDASEAATVVFRFLGSGGQSSSLIRTIAPRSRITLELPANGPTPSNDFSTVIESDRLVVVDRTMTWDSTGYGAHAETAIVTPSMEWHLAEGATHGAFDLFYLLQNANDSQAHVTIEYLRQAPLTPVLRTYTVEPNSRRTIAVDAEGPELAAVDVAAAITSDLPIVAERAMYSTRPGQPAFAAGHGAAGVTEPSLRWFLAEGATGYFDLFVLVSNPNTVASTLKVTYLLPDGAPFEMPYEVGPKQRLTINVQDQDVRLTNTPVSVIVESTNNRPVVVERAMWWPKGEWHEAHVSAGATTTGTRWALADGEVTVGGDTYILIANTSTTAGTATVTLLEEGGTPRPIVVNLPASSRVSVPVSIHLPPTETAPRRRFGALIESNGVEIVVESSVYATAGGIVWGSGTAALGTKLQ